MKSHIIILVANNILFIPFHRKAIVSNEIAVTSMADNENAPVCVCPVRIRYSVSNDRVLAPLAVIVEFE